METIKSCGNMPARPTVQTPVKAIRWYCVEFCCCGNTAEVRKCEIESCSLWPYRMGKNPVAAAKWAARQKKN